MMYFPRTKPSVTYIILFHPFATYYEKIRGFISAMKRHNILCPARERVGFTWPGVVERCRPAGRGFSWPVFGLRRGGARSIAGPNTV